MTDKTPTRTARDSHYADLRRQYRDRHGGSAPEPLRLYGIHTVTAALANPERTVLRVLATRNAAARLELADGKFELVDPKKLARLVGDDAVHQGVVIEVEPLREHGLENLPETDLVLLLDQVTDPHNVGAVLRSAVAMGAGAVIATSRHAPSETMALAKAASGALEHVPLVRVRNLSSAIEVLAAKGYQTVGLDSDGETDLTEALVPGPIALVLGAEGKGLRQKTRETVKTLACIDMPGPIKSLNVSNAAALALFVARRHLGTPAPR